MSLAKAMKCTATLSLLLICTLPVSGQPWGDTSLTVSQRVDSLVEELETAEKIALLSADSPGVPRLDIPAYHWWNEALHGVARNGRATVFPQAINLAATFDDALVRRAASVISTEARAKYNLSRDEDGGTGQYGGLTFWSPNINLFRDLRWGRGQETYGEDPYLTSRIGAAFVRGMQGDHPRYLKTAAAAKHFAVHSGPEAGRSSFDARASDRDLAQTYLPAFEYLVREAGVAGVMCSYNRINGVPACAHEPLLRDTLRGRWGFDGYMVSDCGAVGNIYGYHGYAESPAEAAAQALRSGVNINCGNNWGNHLPEAIRQGLASEEDLDRALREALPVLFRLGMFDRDRRDPWRELGEGDISTDEHRALARKAARQGMVLLKNEGPALPLSRDLHSLAVMGPVSTSAEVMLGNYYGTPDRLSTFLEGISGAVGGGTKLIHYPGIGIDEGSVSESGWGISQAQTTEAIVACIGLSPQFEGEGMEAVTGTGEPSAGLPEHQVEWVRALREGYEKPLVVVVTGGSPRAIPEVHQLADAVIWAGYPGQAGGEALADLIFGETSPSGKLPVTVPYRTDDLPPFEDYGMEGRTYRFLENEPLYPFGFGLSYTTFQYGELRLEQDELGRGDTLSFSVRVENTGDRGGGEVVQVYLKDQESNVRVPRFRLVDFSRISLESGESRTLRFRVPPEVMKVTDKDGKGFYEAGRFAVFVGGASPMPRSRELGAREPATAYFHLR